MRGCRDDRSAERRGAGTDRGDGAGTGAGGDRRRRGDRLQHRLPPGPPGLDGRGAARAAPADGRHDLACRRADHLGRDDRRDRAVLQPVLPGPVRPAGAGDRALHRLPRGRAHLAGHHPGAAGGTAPGGGLDARVRRRGHRDLPARAGRHVAAGPHRRRAVRVLRRGRGPGRPGGGGHLAGQGRPAAGRAGGGGGGRDRGGAGGPPGAGRAHRAGPDRDRRGGERGGHVGPAVRRAGRGQRPAAGRRALLPAHRHGARDGPGPAGHRGPGQLRLLPARGRRHAGGLVRARRRAVVAGRSTPRVFVRQDKSRLGADGALPRPGAGPDPGAGGNRGADVLLRAGVVHRRRPPAARARPRAGRLFRRGRAELARHPVRRRGGQDARALDRGRRAAGGRDRGRHRPDAPVRVLPAVPRRADGRAARRAVRGRGLARLEAVHRPERAPVGAARPAGRRGRALRRLGRLGIRRVVRGPPGRSRRPAGASAARPRTRSSAGSTPRCARRSACWT